MHQAVAKKRHAVGNISREADFMVEGEMSTDAALDPDLRARLELAAAAAGIGPNDTASRQAVNTASGAFTKTEPLSSSVWRPRPPRLWPRLCTA